MKQTGENGKTKFFSTTSIGLCALCTFFVKSQLTFLKVNTLTVTIVGSSLTHQKSWGWGGEITKVSGLECKTAFGRVLKPTINFYTDQHILPSVYLVFYSQCILFCTSFSFFFI